MDDLYHNAPRTGYNVAAGMPHGASNSFQPIGRILRNMTMLDTLFPAGSLETNAVDGAAHLIQLALTPVFMLSGIGTLINIFNTRLARVSDLLEEIDRRIAMLEAPPPSSVAQAVKDATAPVASSWEDTREAEALARAQKFARNDIEAGLKAAPAVQAPDPYFTPERLLAYQSRLHCRVFVLDLAIILNALGGAFTCGSAIALFVGSLRDVATATWLLLLFGLALGSTVLALGAFLVDTLFSWHGLRHDRMAALLIWKRRGNAHRAAKGQKRH